MRQSHTHLFIYLNYLFSGPGESGGIRRNHRHWKLNKTVLFTMYDLISNVWAGGIRGKPEFRKINKLNQLNKCANIIHTYLFT